ncbi:hypothetical protein [Arthrobacter sp. NPDC092385]|uniref:hypothetical protein n=1 Tax=Arthrobacter sp. NPDC092385 TaxID=3363943 RepID=UPI0037F19D80
MGPRGQEPNESTDDAVWLDLVARLEGPSADPDSPDAPQRRSGATPARPAPPQQGTSAVRRTDDDDARVRPDADGDGLTDRERVDAVFRNQPGTSAGPRDYEAFEDPDDDGGFTPEEPPPLGSGDPLTVLAWIGAAGGPVLLLLFAMFWQDAPLAATLGVLALFLAGAGYLVTKLPKHRDIGDDGAEV